jgi:hypothetical protein
MEDTEYRRELPFPKYRDSDPFPPPIQSIHGADEKSLRNRHWLEPAYLKGYT